MATWILGVSALYHDAAAVLLRDGVVVAAAQEERFSRIKQDPSLPVRAVAWCLAEHGLTPADLDWLVFYEKPLRKFERVLATAVATFPRSWRAFPRHMLAWLGDKLWLRNSLVQTFGVPAERLLFSEHHLSHAASAFLCSPFDRAAVLTVDGVGEVASTGLWHGVDEAPFVRPVAEVRFPHSLGLFYSALTAYLGFAVNEGEYKVMGMAAFGEPRFADALGALVPLDASGGFSLDLQAFSFHWHPTRSYTGRLEALLGPPRFPGTPFDPAGDPESQRFADIAASAQAVLERTLLHLARHAREATGESRLCLAGGVALNAVANHRLAVEAGFEEVWIQPAAGDAGGALGAALWAWHDVLGHPRGEALRDPTLGKAWSRDAVRELLDDLELDHEDLGSAETSVPRAADELAEGKVIAWCAGAFEWGPRALGQRSILADPRGPEIQARVNASIKFREAFRPFAPAVRAEDADTWFDVHPAEREAAHFMLTAVPVRQDAPEPLPATTHVDGTARVQLVDGSRTPLFHALLSAFAERTGVPVLLNTSFNLKGEPMAAGPVDALATLMRCDLDALYLEGFRVTRSSRLSGEQPL